MTIQKALRTAMKRQRTSQLTLSKLSRINQSTISTLTKRGGTLALYIRLFDELGFEVCVRPKHRGILAEDHYVLSIEDEPEVVEEPEISWYAALAEK